LPDDPEAQLSRGPFLEAVRAYNLLRGWSAEGWPTDQLLAELQLDDC
jgi:hypothetical protein